jgi:hypothetical protein
MEEYGLEASRDETVMKADELFEVRGLGVVVTVAASGSAGPKRCAGRSGTWQLPAARGRASYYWAPFVLVGGGAR